MLFTLRGGQLHLAASVTLFVLASPRVTHFNTPLEVRVENAHSSSERDTRFDTVRTRFRRVWSAILSEDELRKLGLRVRRRAERVRRQNRPGHIAFDDRGNAIYEWNDERLGDEGEDAERLRKRALAHPGLAVVEDEPNPNEPIRNNPKGLRLGYNPYESGLL